MLRSSAGLEVHENALDLHLVVVQTRHVVGGGEFRRSVCPSVSFGNHRVNSAHLRLDDTVNLQIRAEHNAQRQSEADDEVHYRVDD